QTPAASLYSPRITSSSPLESPFFSAAHGVVQTHPALGNSNSLPLNGNSLGSGGVSSTLSVGSGYLNSRGNLPKFNTQRYPQIANTVVDPNPQSPFRHLDFSTSATAELRRNPTLSAPDECARACREGEPPRICYYHFT
ncbi:uncharacterized protein LOC118755445, partial [Rhagoletis pomonella]